jgi:hypothetical protein
MVYLELKKKELDCRDTMKTDFSNVNYTYSIPQFLERQNIERVQERRFCGELSKCTIWRPNLVLLELLLML